MSPRRRGLKSLSGCRTAFPAGDDVRRRRCRTSAAPLTGRRGGHTAATVHARPYRQSSLLSDRAGGHGVHRRRVADRKAADGPTFRVAARRRSIARCTTNCSLLPVETLVYPAHDYRGRQSSSIGHELASNPRLGGGRTMEEFAAIMAALDFPYPKKIDVAVPANRLAESFPARPKARSARPRKDGAGGRTGRRRGHPAHQITVAAHGSRPVARATGARQPRTASAFRSRNRGWKCRSI